MIVKKLFSARCGTAQFFPFITYNHHIASKMYHTILPNTILQGIFRVIQPVVMSFSVTGDLQCRLSSTDRSFTVKVLTFDDNSCEKLISMETLAYMNVEFYFA